MFFLLYVYIIYEDIDISFDQLLILMFVHCVGV
jgi:hypothetical protein